MALKLLVCALLICFLTALAGARADDFVGGSAGDDLDFLPAESETLDNDVQPLATTSRSLFETLDVFGWGRVLKMKHKKHHMHHHKGPVSAPAPAPGPHHKKHHKKHAHAPAPAKTHEHAPAPAPSHKHKHRHRKHAHAPHPAPHH